MEKIIDFSVSTSNNHFNKTNNHCSLAAHKSMGKNNPHFIDREGKSTFYVMLGAIIKHSKIASNNHLFCVRMQ